VHHDGNITQCVINVNKCKLIDDEKGKIKKGSIIHKLFVEEESDERSRK